jgi:hypothetical protein
MYDEFDEAYSLGMADILAEACRVQWQNGNRR